MIFKTDKELQEKQKQFEKFKKIQQQQNLKIKKMIDNVNQKKEIKKLKLQNIKNNNKNVNEENIVKIIQNTKNKPNNQVLPKITNIEKPKLNDSKNNQNIQIPKRILEMQQKQREIDEKNRKKFLDFAQNDYNRMKKVHLKHIQFLDNIIFGYKQTQDGLDYVIKKFNVAGKIIEICLNHNKNILKVFINNNPVFRTTNNKSQSTLKESLKDLKFKDFQIFYKIFNEKINEIEADRGKIEEKINQINSEKNILNNKFQNKIYLPYLNKVNQNVNQNIPVLPMANYDTIIPTFNSKLIDKLRNSINQIFNYMEMQHKKHIEKVDKIEKNNKELFNYFQKLNNNKKLVFNQHKVANLNFDKNNIKI